MLIEKRIFVWEKSYIFPYGKINYFSVWKIVYFSVWKNQGFLLAVLYWTVDSGQWTVDSGQWTVDRRTVQYGIMGHWTGHPVLDRSGSGQLDSGRDRVDKSTVLTLVY